MASKQLAIATKVNARTALHLAINTGDFSISFCTIHLFLTLIRFFDSASIEMTVQKSRVIFNLLAASKTG
jgi:hypothetical protein